MDRTRVEQDPVSFSPDILQEFFESLGSLWVQRESVIFAPDWTLRELAHLEERAEAHLDGLRLSGEDGVRLARPFLAGEEKGPATAAAFVFMHARRPDLEAEVAKALANADVPAKEGIGMGLRHSDVSGIAPELRRLAAESDPATRSIAADVLAFHRLGPPPARLLELFNHDDPVIRARAYAAAGRFGAWSADELPFALDHADPRVRWAAIHASARLGMPNLASTLRRVAKDANKVIPEAIEFLGVLGDPNDLPLLQDLLVRPASRKAALAALGASGRITVVPPLLDALKDPAATVEAGKAFVRMTGATGIDGSAPSASTEGVSENGGKAPDPLKASEWWDREKARFTADARWQGGVRLTRPATLEQLDALPLASRRDVFLGDCSAHPQRAREFEPEARTARATA